jgi:hypothetical protein
MPEKYPASGEKKEEPQNEQRAGKPRSSRVPRIVGNLAAAGLVAAGMAMGTEASAQEKHHVRTNAEEGEKEGFMVVPQDEQELEDLIADAKADGEKNQRQPEFTESSVLAYEILYAAKKNDGAELGQLLKEYYALVASHPGIADGAFQEPDESAIDVLLKHGHIDTALAVVKHIPNKKIHDRLLHQIHAAHIGEQEKERGQN